MLWLKYALALTTLVGFWGAGLGLSPFIPLPASLLGLLLLLLGLVWLKRIPSALLRVSQFVLGHMLILFVPATMGILLFAEKLADNLLWLVLSIMLSTLVSLGVTAWICQRQWQNHAHANTDNEHVKR
ncbi:CidA/LrgA family protein [Paraglaciecola polaris]|uniref:Holin-like protein n=1 Tax=Paraglaciecola polaris LMG 21857 TaxID=1129793 RepID=K7AID2_9ALTE|nr:CidA/LrgA family protein [Paraglaciecola polaris]GAC35015.1 holin-like protein [Paraglaciecola polaris LMG 21857]|tara:strand:- start:602 stop:985 length:384 start_codon:yes stop_codon:yes gene_type:complete